MLRPATRCAGAGGGDALRLARAVRDRDARARVGRCRRTGHLERVARLALLELHAHELAVRPRLDAAAEAQVADGVSAAEHELPYALHALLDQLAHPPGVAVRVAVDHAPAVVGQHHRAAARGLDVRAALELPAARAGVGLPVGVARLAPVERLPLRLLDRLGPAHDLPLLRGVLARPQVAVVDAELLAGHAAQALDEVLRAVERVLEDHDLEALGIAQVVRELVDQDAVEDARVVVAHQRRLHRPGRDLVGLDDEVLQHHRHDDGHRHGFDVVAPGTAVVGLFLGLGAHGAQQRSLEQVQRNAGDRSRADRTPYLTRTRRRSGVWARWPSSRSTTGTNWR